MRNDIPYRSSTVTRRRILAAATVAAAAIALISCGETKTSPSKGLVILNEFNCYGRDWVEIVNTTESEIDISSWYFADDLSDEGHQYAVPEGTSIQPGEYLVIKKETDTEAGFSFGLKCGEDTAYLLDKNKAIVDQADIGNAAYGRTWGHLPDLTGLWRETYPTEGLPNEAAPSN